MQKRAILYVRVSTDEQSNGYSPDYQQERLIQYCAVQDIHIVAIYREDYTAKHFNRPEFNKILTFLKKKKGEADLLLFLRWDRFSRNTSDAYGMITTLHKLKVEPQSVEQPLDLNVPENKMMLAFYLAAPEVENERRALNILVNMRKARKGGRWLGQAPKGYLNGKDELNKPLLIPNPKIAPIIQFVFEELAKGVHNIEAVRKMANEKGLVLSSNPFWSLVHNPVYCGKVKIGAYKNEAAHLVKGIHQPIISEQLFNDVQDIIEGRKRKTRIVGSKDENLPLKGFLICSKCGRPLTGSGSKGNGGKYYYYHCQDAAKCKERFRANIAHETFMDTLHQITAHSEILELYQQIMLETFKKNGIDKSQQLKVLQTDIDKLKLRLKNAQTLMLDGELTASDFYDIRNNLVPEIEKLENKKVALLTSEDDYQEYLKKSIPMLKNIDKAFTEADYTIKQEIVGSMFPEKLIFDKNTYRTNEPNPLLSLIDSNGKCFGVAINEKGRKKSDLSQKVVRPGFEPRMTESKSVVLPLHHRTIGLQS